MNKAASPHRRLRLPAVLSCVVALTIGPVASAQNFLQDLGAGSAVGMNNSVQVLYSDHLYSNGTSTALPANFLGLAINASGEVAGQDGAQAAIYSAGTVTDIGFLPGGNPTTDFSYATGINAAGEVLGYGAPSNGVDAWFIYSGGVMTVFDSLPGMPPGSRGSALNDLGALTGATKSGDAFIYDHGVFTDIGGGVGEAINSAGQVTGQLPNYPNSIHAPAFLYSNGMVINLGAIPTGASGIGTAINASGQVVGNSFSNDFGNHPFLYNGTMNDLNSLIASTDPLQPYVTLSYAIAINDNGLILAVGTDSRVGNATPHSYLLQAPALNVSPGSLTFSGALGKTSAPQVETVTNVSSTPLALTNIATSGDFAQSNNCGATLAPGASCTVSVTFSPVLAGDSTGSLTVTSLEGPVVVPLTGSVPINVAVSTSAATTTAGTPVTLTWTISQGSTCSKTGGSSADGWTGSTSANGSQTVTESAAGTFQYGLSCTIGSQSASNQVAVIVSWPALTIGLTASPTTITAGNSTTLTWDAANAKTCTASGGGTDDGWGGTTRPISGSAVISEPVVLASSLTLTYSLTCSNSGTGQTTTSSVKVVLNPPPSSGGGGGAVDLCTALGLGGLLLTRARRSDRRPAVGRSHALSGPQLRLPKVRSHDSTPKRCGGEDIGSQPAVLAQVADFTHPDRCTRLAGPNC